MKKTEIPQTNVSRRDLLKGAGLLAGASLIGCESPTAPRTASLAAGAATGRKRVAVIGSGTGGIAAAYFLAKDFDVEIFESRSKIGGHCDSRVVDYKGTKVNADLGAQFFHPDTHPTYVSLLEEMGLFLPDNKDNDETIEAPGSICFFKRNSWWPVFSSKHPYLTPVIAIDFVIYSQAARQVILGNQSWEMTLEEWVKKLPTTQGFKDSLLYPWISATIGTTLENAKRSSARSILQTFALAFPANIFAGASTFNSKLGLGGNLQRILEKSPGVQVRLDSPVNGVANQNGLWTLTTPSGSYGPFDAVVMNAPPHISKNLLQPLPWASDIVANLAKFEWFETRMLIHTDAKYVHSNKDFWSAYNGLIDGTNSEGSVWYGGIHPKLPNGQTLDVFKSWASRRFADPSNIIYERKFIHPHITPQGIRAARSLKGFQGRNGLYFSGQATTGFDLQESAVYSAMKVADALAPASAPLAALRARMKSRGRTNINYDL